MSMRELKAREDAAKTELKNVIAQQMAGDATPELETRAAELEAELKRIDAAERRQAMIDDMDRNARGHQLTGQSSDDDRLDAECANIGIGDVIRSQLPEFASSHMTGKVREVSQELARRSGSTPQGLLWNMRVPAKVEQRVLTTTATGSNIIGTDYRPDLYIDVLRAQPGVARLGATTLSGLTGNVAIPKALTSTNTQWVSENSAITASDFSFGQVTLSPHHLGSLSEFSRNMVLQSSPDVEQLLRNDMSANLAMAMDRAAIKGVADPSPTGR